MHVEKIHDYPSNIALNYETDTTMQVIHHKYERRNPYN